MPVKKPDQLILINYHIISVLVINVCNLNVRDLQMSGTPLNFLPE